MSKISINIQIGDRTYPLKVEAEEVERLKKSGKVLNSKIKDYQKKFGLDDIQDLLAMVAFDSTINEHKHSTSLVTSNQQIGDKLERLNRFIDSLKLKR